ncbi:MAG: alpha/beta hydrolase [Candidatus Didemnitutus sp.]|nr:alpha/beta hydrolase [Candidatus Didemnitutus sp.]
MALHDYGRIGCWLIVAGLVLYVALTALAAGIVDGMLYYPDYASRKEPANVIRIPTPGGGSLAAVYLPNPAAKHTLWFFHGNAEDLGSLEPFLREMHARGYAVFAYDYPGYGVSTGKPNEKAIYAANAVAARYLQDKLKVPLSQVILVGRSLGGGPATDLATREPVAGLVLQSTFMSVYRVMTRVRLLPFDQFENLRKIGRVKCPVLVMHGTADEVIAFPHGEKLYAAATGRKSHLWIEGAQHNDFVAVAGERFWTALREFDASLP